MTWRAALAVVAAVVAGGLLGVLVAVIGDALNARRTT